MTTEFSSVLAVPGRVVDWANAINYKAELTSEDKEISNLMDAWAKEIGRTGFDRDHELSALITKAISPDVVTTPGELIDRMFNSSAIGEFDDYRGEVSPKNTIKVYEAVRGGNVDRSFIDFKALEPSWVTLQAETDISLAEIRRGGYKTVATLINFISEALEAKKIATIMSKIDTAVVEPAPGFITEGGSAPTATSADALALYLLDVADDETPLIFGLNKYIQAISNLPGAVAFATDREKSLYNSTGLLRSYAGCELMGLSGQKKLADGSFIVPTQRLFGVAGKVGECITRGETQTFQNTDTNSEKIHIKVGGYQFGVMFTDISKVGKMLISKA